MQPNITRRTFLLSFVPPWFTGRNLTFAGVAALGALLAAVIVSIFQHVDLPSLLKPTGIALGALLVLALIAWLGTALGALTKKSPPWISALVSVLWQIVEFAAAGAFGIYVYRRWQQGEDLSGLALTLGATYFYRFQAEWEKRSKSASRAVALGADRAN